MRVVLTFFCCFRREATKKVRERRGRRTMMMMIRAARQVSYLRTYFEQKQKFTGGNTSQVRIFRKHALIVNAMHVRAVHSVCEGFRNTLMRKYKTTLRQMEHQQGKREMLPIRQFLCSSYTSTLHNFPLV